ncbi:hypothetical protein BH20GEM2_BH20GEM2_13460 [soil metagenome]
MHRFVRWTIGVASLAIAPALADAQQKPAVPSQNTVAVAEQKSPTPQQQEWISELQKIAGQLQATQVKALQDSSLRSAQEGLGTDIKTAMEKYDPGLVGVAQRVQTMEEEARKAQENGDQAKLQELTREAAQIQARFVKAQTEALKDPALASRAQAFEERLKNKMLEIQPDAPTLFARFRELQTKLAESTES